MDNKYPILSFDFGDGETVATFFDGQKCIHCYFDRTQHQKLYSIVFRTGDNYSLTSGDTLLINLKKHLLDAHKKIANKKDARILQAEADFKGFIRCVVDAVVRNNDINITDCVLSYAYPASFYACSDKQNQELERIYKSIIESVLKDFKPQKIVSIDEAEASFYCKGSTDKNCFVIDAGSSTLDFALFVHGRKVPLSAIHNSTLGASVIEEHLYNHFRDGDTFAKNAQKIENAYSVDLHYYFVRALRERKEVAYIKKRYLKLGSYELSNDLPIEPKYDSEFSFQLANDFNSLPSIVTY